VTQIPRFLKTAETEEETKTEKEYGKTEGEDKKGRLYSSSRVIATCSKVKATLV